MYIYGIHAIAGNLQGQTLKSGKNKIFKKKHSCIAIATGTISV
jgi:hypothetical protein